MEGVDNKHSKEKDKTAPEKAKGRDNSYFKKVGHVEAKDHYRPGGFHPVHIGDKLDEDGRFRVVHKLGHGGYGTVWLCRDAAHGVWRAVKVIMAIYSGHSCREWVALNELRSVLSEAEACHVSLPIEHFFLDGPNGRHLCLVSRLHGPNLGRIWAEGGHDADLLRWICFQLVEGMAFLHSRGICHGDFRSSNVLRRLRAGFDTMSEDEMAKKLSPIIRIPIPEESEPNPHVPRYCVCVADLRAEEGALTDEVAIIDFGVSYLASNPPRHVGIPTALAAPEIVYDALGSIRPGFATDIWALGTAICEVRLGDSPFGSELERYSIDLECCLGELPEPYRTYVMQRVRNWETHSEFLREQEEEKRGPLGARMCEYGTDDWLAGHAGRKRNIFRVSSTPELYFHPSDKDGSDAGRQSTAGGAKAGTTKAKGGCPELTARTNIKLVEYRLRHDELLEYNKHQRTKNKNNPRGRADVWTIAKHPYFRGCGPLRVKNPAELPPPPSFKSDSASLIKVGVCVVSTVLASMTIGVLGGGV